MNEINVKRMTTEGYKNAIDGKDDDNEEEKLKK